MMKVVFVSEAPEDRRELIGFLREDLEGRGWKDVEIKYARSHNFAVDQQVDPVSILLIDILPESRSKPIFEALKRCHGDPPIVLCTYPARSPVIADCAVDYGAKACLDVPAEKLKDRDTVMEFFRENLAGLPDPEIETASVDSSTSA
jgi:hypothetical protein